MARNLNRPSPEQLRGDAVAAGGVDWPGAQFHHSFHGEPGHAGKHLLIVGAYQSTDVNEGWDWDPVVYWLGNFNGAIFDLATASGPHRCARRPRDTCAARFAALSAPLTPRLDYGDAPYAPNVMKDAHGRTVMFAWLREKWPAALSHAPYSGCLSAPRVLSLTADGRLFAAPHPDLKRLRGEAVWSSRALEGGDDVTWVQGAVRMAACTSPQLDIKLALTR